MQNRAVHLFVFDTLVDWEPSFAVGGMKARAGSPPLTTVAATREPVTTLGGIRIVPDATLAEINPSQSRMLILSGGEQWENGGNAETLATVRAWIAGCVPVAASGAAAAALGRAGLLDNRYHTGNNRESLAATGYRGARFYRDVPAIADQGVITASGIAPLDFAAAIFEALNLGSSCKVDGWRTPFKYGTGLQHQWASRAANFSSLQ